MGESYLAEPFGSDIEFPNQKVLETAPGNEDGYELYRD
jgi:hypothetical protein